MLFPIKFMEKNVAKTVHVSYSIINSGGMPTSIVVGNKVLTLRRLPETNQEVRELEERLDDDVYGPCRRIIAISPLKR